MAYFHILLHPVASTDVTLRFKDLSEDQLRATFRKYFHNPTPSDLSVIRTERPHVVEVADYMRNYWEQVRSFVNAGGVPGGSSPDDNSAIKGAGVDITEAFLRDLEKESRELPGLTPGDLY
jgi:hypothetical protein